MKSFCHDSNDGEMKILTDDGQSAMVLRETMLHIT